MNDRQIQKQQVKVPVQLDVERTLMANDRTFLSFVRTSLYFFVAGLTLQQLVNISYGLLIQIACFLVGALVFGIGYYKYHTQKRKIRNSRSVLNKVMDDDE